jgi:hypothetical protein
MVFFGNKNSVGCCVNAIYYLLFLKANLEGVCWFIAPLIVGGSFCRVAIAFSFGLFVGLTENFVRIDIIHMISISYVYVKWSVIID